MSKFRFNIATDTTAKGDFAFAGNQAEKAEYYGVERVFNFRDLRGCVGSLPKYVKSAIKDAGFEAVYLGGTTFSHSVIGLRRLGEHNEVTK